MHGNSQLQTDSKHRASAPVRTLADGQIHRSVIVRVSATHAVERNSEGRLALSLRRKRDKLPVSSAFQHRLKGM